MDTLLSAALRSLEWGWVETVQKSRDRDESGKGVVEREVMKRKGFFSRDCERKWRMEGWAIRAPAENLESKRRVQILLGADSSWKSK